MVFGNKREKLLKAIELAKEKKKLSDLKDKAKDIKLNKMIADREELDQLKFELSRLKNRNMSSSEKIIFDRKVAKAKSLANSLGVSLGKFSVGVGKTFLSGGDKVIRGLFALGGGNVRTPVKKKVKKKAVKKKIVKKVVKKKPIKKRVIKKKVKSKMKSKIKQRPKKQSKRGKKK